MLLFHIPGVKLLWFQPFNGNKILPLGCAERGISIRFDVHDVYFRNGFSIVQRNGYGWFYAGSSAVVEAVLSLIDFASLRILFSYTLPEFRSLAYIGAHSMRNFGFDDAAPFVRIGVCNPTLDVVHWKAENALLVTAEQLDIGPIPTKIRLVFKAEDRFMPASLVTSLATSTTGE
jgi:hypothetical protein